MILFVDDNAVMREVVSLIFQENQIEATIVRSGNSAISWLKKNLPCTLIVTDIHMNDGSGVDLVIWQKEHRSKLPVIFVTGDNTIDLQEKQFMEIMDLQILKKPFTPAQLLTEINKAIDH